MIIYFFISIIHSMAQRYAKRRDEEYIHHHLHPECRTPHWQHTPTHTLYHNTSITSDGIIMVIWYVHTGTEWTQFYPLCLIVFSPPLSSVYSYKVLLLFGLWLVRWTHDFKYLDLWRGKKTTATISQSSTCMRCSKHTVYLVYKILCKLLGFLEQSKDICQPGNLGLDLAQQNNVH